MNENLPRGQEHFWLVSKRGKMLSKKSVNMDELKWNDKYNEEVHEWIPIIVAYIT